MLAALSSKFNWVFFFLSVAQPVWHFPARVTGTAEAELWAAGTRDKQWFSGLRLQAWKYQQKQDCNLENRQKQKKNWEVTKISFEFCLKRDVIKLPKYLYLKNTFVEESNVFIIAYLEKWAPKAKQPWLIIFRIALLDFKCRYSWYAPLGQQGWSLHKDSPHLSKQVHVPSLVLFQEIKTILPSYWAKMTCFVNS